MALQISHLRGFCHQIIFPFRYMSLQGHEHGGFLHGPAGSGGLRPPFIDLPKATLAIASGMHLRRVLPMAAASRHSCAVEVHNPLRWETSAGWDRILAGNL